MRNGTLMDPQVERRPREGEASEVRGRMEAPDEQPPVAEPEKVVEEEVVEDDVVEDDAKSSKGLRKKY